MKLLVTGAQGMLGRDLVRLAATRNVEVWPTDLAEAGSAPDGRLDVTDQPGLKAAIDTFRPDAIAHLAAMTNVDDCERFPERAYLVNTVGTENLALLCARHDLPLVYISTGSVFDGTKADPYHEFDDPAPLSAYARSKWQGEQIVRTLVPKHFVLRAGWMFGGGPEDKKFVAKMIDRVRSGGSLRAVDDKFGSPSYTVDVSQRCLEVLDTDRYGTYHSANEGCCSRYEMARAIVDFAGLEADVQPCSSAEFPLPAPRPRQEGMVGLHAKLVGLPAMRPWRDSLREYIQSTLIDVSG